jgi:hypothetical protein
MKASFIPLISAVILLCACHEYRGDKLAPGQMPNLAKGDSGTLHLVYGNGDSILYSYATDGGHSFFPSSVVAVVPGLAASHMRGPQVAATANGVAVIACTNDGDIFSFTKDASGKWAPAVKVNDADTVAKENLIALAADGDITFAVWQDLRSGYNQLYGARSTDGGRTWSKNMLVYASPDKEVCSCCKPSVAVKGNNVYVMFRNWLNGNRDLYLIQSADGGVSFGQAQKLGKGSWALNGCPMDGGGIVINSSGNPETVWRRERSIYACEPGKEEKILGEGKSCVIESANGKNLYAWEEDGDIVVMGLNGEKTKVGKGHMPVLKMANGHLVCVWEDDEVVRKVVLE